MPDYPTRLNIDMPASWRKRVPLVAAAVVFLLILISAFYQIGPEQIGVVLRFGKYVRTTNPGLHLKIPIADEVNKVPVQRQLKMEFGFRTAQAGIETQYATTSESEREAVMLTGDLNVVKAGWIVQYRISDPLQYLFKLRDVEATFRYMNEAVVRKVVGDHSVDEVITVGRASIADQAKQELQALCDNYEIGIEVNQLLFRDVNPPEPVKPSFNEVNESLQEKERKINEAWSEYNQEIPRAAGEAKRVIQTAEGYATERVNNARGDSSRFAAVYLEFARAPLVTRKRLYLETINEIIPKISRKIIFDETQNNILPLLNLREEVQE